MFNKKPKEVHYVLVGTMICGSTDCTTAMSAPRYSYDWNEIHKFECRELAELWVLEPAQTQRRKVYRIVKEIQVWKPETTYKKTLDNTQR